MVVKRETRHHQEGKSAVESTQKALTKEVDIARRRGSPRGKKGGVLEIENTCPYPRARERGDAIPERLQTNWELPGGGGKSYSDSKPIFLLRGRPISGNLTPMGMEGKL